MNRMNDTQQHLAHMEKKKFWYIPYKSFKDKLLKEMKIDFQVSLTQYASMKKA